MQLSLRHKKLLAFALLSLLLGIVNYFLFQSRIAIFSFISKSLPKPYFIRNTALRHFLTGYFSDIAWCCALYLVAVVLSELKRLNLFEKISILLLPFMTEAAQYFRIINGTFDWFDLLVYAIILLLFFICYPVLKSLHNEK
jgi:hypothetical protein